MSDKKKRYMLPEEEIPHYWYNIQADMVKYRMVWYFYYPKLNTYS